MTEIPQQSNLGWPGDMQPPIEPAPRRVLPRTGADHSMAHLLAAGITHENEDPFLREARLEVAKRVSAEQSAQSWKTRALTAEGKIPELEQLAFTDELTGLPNRRAIMRTIGNLILKEPGTFGLMFIDLDNLKEENKKGYDEGDKLIIRTASSIIGSSLRTHDAGGHPKRPHDIEGSDAARLGGDEFLVVVRGLVTDETHSAQDKLTIVNHRIITNLEDADVSASTGMAIHAEGQTAEELVNFTNRAADLNKAERRAEKQVRERAELPQDERVDLYEVKALADELGVSVTSLWRHFGPTSR